MWLRSILTLIFILPVILPGPLSEQDRVCFTHGIIENNRVFRIDLQDELPTRYIAMIGNKKVSRAAVEFGRKEIHFLEKAENKQ